VAHRSVPQSSASRNIAVQQQSEAGIVTTQQCGSKTHLKATRLIGPKRAAGFTLTY
jgi:hypothetical protein